MNQDNDLSRMPSYRERYVAMASWLAYLAQVLETSVVVFLRRGFGRRYLGGHAAAVLVLVPLYSLLWEGHDPRPLFVFLGLYLLACVWARLGITWRRIRGRDTVHSYYSGTPPFMGARFLGARISERTAKGVIDPLCVAAIGLWLMQFSEPLGWYLVLAAGGLMASVRMAVAHQQKRVLDMRDAYLSQRSVAEQFRREGWQ